MNIEYVEVTNAVINLFEVDVELKIINILFERKFIKLKSRAFPWNAIFGILGYRFFYRF